MTDDETRGNECPDRQDESRQSTTVYRQLIEAIDVHASNLLQEINTDETLEQDTTRAAKRHCRELRAELDCLRRHLPGTDEWNRQTSGRWEGSITTASGPFEAVLEAARRGAFETEDTPEDGTQPDETGGEGDE
ncbi:hypothetical protein [Natrinema salinisoli]|uniref:hypothetical protein n=1 Tax=Natrinema salinisoli TaxID=2878535 RepID=UPI001CF0C1EB|nr:hypothetical protein [Natrinema salinisoli]